MADILTPDEVAALQAKLDATPRHEYAEVSLKEMAYLKAGGIVGHSVAIPPSTQVPPWRRNPTSYAYESSRPTPREAMAVELRARMNEAHPPFLVQPAQTAGLEAEIAKLQEIRRRQESYIRELTERCDNLRLEGERAIRRCEVLESIVGHLNGLIVNQRAAAPTAPAADDPKAFPTNALSPRRRQIGLVLPK